MALAPIPDLQALAQQVGTTLQPYMPLFSLEAAKAAGKNVPAAIGKVWDLVKDRFAKKPAAEEALRDLLKDPNDPDLQAAVRVQLRKLLEEDAEFTAKLRPVAEAAATQTTTYQADVKGDGNYTIQGSGNTINAGPGGDSKKK